MDGRFPFFALPQLGGINKELKNMGKIRDLHPRNGGKPTIIK